MPEQNEVVVNRIIWKNTAKWARNTMVREGLLHSEFERGLWEITEKGIEIAIGKAKNPEYDSKYLELLQLTYESDILPFIYNRFRKYLYQKKHHPQFI